MLERNVLQITPFMHVADLDEAVRFFADILGFELLLTHSNYAYVHREHAGIRIQQHDEPVELGAPHGGFAYYVDVRNLDAIIAELKPRLDTLPAGHVYGPKDQSYGQRELLIRAPDGNLVVFGQAIG